MKLLDVNIVVAAHRDDHVQFTIVRPWLDELIASRQAFAVADLVAGSFVRIATNHRIYEVPRTAEEAFSFIRALRAQPGHVKVAPGPAYLDLFERMCVEGSATGNLVPDAYLAALAIEHAAEVVSFDRDFARFPGLRWSVPGPTSAS